MMKLFGSKRWLMLALALLLLPVSSFAGVFISVGFAPPVLPVYVQPPCPEPGLMWTPGYWAYGDDGYYWVPGAWVPAPYEGALWTPGYWGWSTGLYVWHPGYWGPHVGYYGGVNYGFGYMGIGFVGGMWRGHDFVYNTAVVHVNERFVHTTYVDRTIVERNTIVNDRHVAFAGGPGGIRHDPLPAERMAERDQHVERTSFQAQHEQSFRADHGSYARFNGGRPNTLAVDRPLSAEHAGPAAHSQMQMGRPAMGPATGPQAARPAMQPQGARPMNQTPQSRPGPQAQPRPSQQMAPGSQNRPAPQAQPRQGQAAHPQAEQHGRPESREKGH